MINEAPTDALRLVPRRATPQQLETAAFNLSAEIGAAEAMKLGPHIERAYELLVAAAPASPLPGGGPHERWSILNHLGESWTPENFDTERQATAYLDSWKRDNPKMDLSKHKVIPVLVTMTAAPTGDARNGKGEGQ